MVVLDLSEEEGDGGGDNMKGPWKSPISGTLETEEIKRRTTSWGVCCRQLDINQRQSHLLAWRAWLTQL